jgi:hypothetical protein
MQMRRHNAENMIACAVCEEAKWNSLASIFLVLIERIRPRAERIEKGAEMEVSQSIHGVETHRRKVRTLPVLLDRIVRREETRGRHYAMEHDENDKPLRELARHCHFALSAVRIRGSAQ